MTIGCGDERQPHMRIELKLYASLERYIPATREGTSFRYMEVEEGTTVGRFLQMLQIPADTVKLIFLNGVHAQMDQVLKEGDRVGVFPPVAGG
jgi:molybdopterin converting factor small subunit